MARRKNKLNFKLDPEWMLKEPLDFEYNKYTILDYIQKCERRFDKLEIYPDFVELSLHLANLQSLTKENTLLLTKKKFESCDDEILLKELYPKKPRELTTEEAEELEKTIKFSGGKLFDAFNVAKSIWNLAFDNISLNIRRNKDNIISGMGYVYYFKKNIQKLFVWEYEIKRENDENINSKTIINLIYEGDSKDVNLIETIKTFSKWNQYDNYTTFPVFELKSNQDFPMNETLIPIMKRKIMSFILQIIDMETVKNFDSSAEI